MMSELINSLFSSVQNILLSNTGLTINSIVTFFLAILSIFYYRRFLPNIAFSHLRYVTLDNRYIDLRITILNKSQSPDLLKDVHLELSDKTKLYPIPESILKNIKISETSFTFNIDEFIQSQQETNNFNLTVRAGKLIETPIFIKPYETLKSRFVFDALNIKCDISKSQLIIKLPHRTKKLTIFKESE